MPLLRKVLSTIRRENLISPGDTVLVGLSGGPDSVTLLHLLSRMRETLQFTLGAIHVNHAIRPEADKEVESSRSLCSTVNCRFHTMRRSVPLSARRNREGIEESARKVRYACFETVAGRSGYSRIALGHHRDDQAETLLFRLFRGAGPLGLSGMAQRRGKYIRPLLSITRQEILDYIERHGLTTLNDQSNNDVRFARNYLRKELIPEIRRRLNPSIDETLIRTADILRLEDDLLARLAEFARDETCFLTPGGRTGIALEPFRRYHTALRRRILRECLVSAWETVYYPDMETVGRLDSWLHSTAVALSLPRGITARKHDGKAYLLSRKVNKCHAELSAPGRATLSLLDVRLDLVPVPRPPKSWKPGSRKAEYADRDTMSFPIEIRTPTTRDKISPLGMNGRKRVTDLLAERGVPTFLRDEALVVADSRGVVWVPGFAIADRVKIRATTRRFLRMTVHYEK